jgi:hypothetical protein
MGHANQADVDQRFGVGVGQSERDGDGKLAIFWEIRASTTTKGELKTLALAVAKWGKRRRRKGANVE